MESTTGICCRNKQAGLASNGLGDDTRSLSGDGLIAHLALDPVAVLVLLAGLCGFEARLELVVQGDACRDELVEVLAGLHSDLAMGGAPGPMLPSCLADHALVEGHQPLTAAVDALHGGVVNHILELLLQLELLFASCQPFTLEDVPGNEAFHVLRLAVGVLLVVLGVHEGIELALRPSRDLLLFDVPGQLLLLAEVGPPRLQLAATAPPVDEGLVVVVAASATAEPASAHVCDRMRLLALGALEAALLDQELLVLLGEGELDAGRSLRGSRWD
jgi:hypothetical protein